MTAGRTASPLRSATRPPPSGPSSRPRSRARARASGLAAATRGLLRRAPVEVHGVDVGRDDEQVGAQPLGEHGGGPVLVDDGLDAGQGARPRPVHRGDATAPGADDHAALVEQPAHRAGLEDAQRRRGRHDPTPGGAVLADRPALLGREPLRVGLGVHRTDELGRVGERRVGRVDLGHRQHGGERLLERQQVPQLLLDQVADHPLGLGAEDVERVAGHVVVRGRLQREQADLRAVAVGDDELVLDRDRGQRPAGGRDVGPLPLDGHRLASALQGVAAQCHHDPHVRSSASARCAGGQRAMARPPPG